MVGAFSELNDEQLCAQVSLLIEEMKERGITDSLGATHAKLSLIGRWAGGAAQREVMVRPEVVQV